MNRKINIDNKEIEYKIKISKRARRLSLKIYLDNKIVVTLPKTSNEKIVEKFLKENSKWLIKKIDYFNDYKKKNKLIVIKKNSYLKQKENAFKLVNEIIEKYNENKEFKLKNIKIKDQKTIWGSCTSRNNININYKIIYLPIKMVEYIIVHELCHLKEMNHSKNFWKLVEIKLPDYYKIRKKLKKIRFNYE